jgi:hypothetical protein
MVFGALAVYAYANYGEIFHQFRRHTLQWRDWAVQQSDHYSAGHQKK